MVMYITFVLKCGHGGRGVYSTMMYKLLHLFFNSVYNYARFKLETVETDMTGYDIFICLRAYHSVD